MPITYHDDIELMAGDDWSINGSLSDADGNPLPLSSAVFGWTLLDPDGFICELVSEASVTVDGDPNGGKIIIAVPGSATAGLPPGRYFDALRVQQSGFTDIEWRGQILVSADPFAQPQEPIVVTP